MPRSIISLLPHRNHRRCNFDTRFRPRSHFHQFLKHAVILRPAVRISRTVLRHRADINSVRANRFRPAHRHGKKMRIAKRHVGYRNFAGMQIILAARRSVDDSAPVRQSANPSKPKRQSPENNSAPLPTARSRRKNPRLRQMRAAPAAPSAGRNSHAAVPRHAFTAQSPR